MKGPLAYSAAKLRDKGQLFFDQEVPASTFPDCLDGEGALRGPISVSLDLAFVSEEFLAKGTVSGEWELECCRCLAGVKGRYDARFEATLPEREGLVDAGEEVRQAIILAIPATRYCREDCKGLCAQCGANRNLKDCGCQQPVPQRFKVTRTQERQHHA